MYNGWVYDEGFGSQLGIKIEVQGLHPKMRLKVQGLDSKMMVEGSGSESRPEWDLGLY